MLNRLRSNKTNWKYRVRIEKLKKYNIVIKQYWLIKIK